MLAQAGIHAGEIDGKDAGLMLLRDIALRGKHHLLDRADFLFVPIFNADGHERTSRFNRPNQRGPDNQGWRTTAQNLNLNRDYLKADTPEMRAMIGLLRRVQPALYLDLHVTDGIDYQYDITFMFPGWDGRYAHSPAIGRWLDSRYRPALDRRADRAPAIFPGPMSMPSTRANPPRASASFADQPRYSTGYADLARIPAVLVETAFAQALSPARARHLCAARGIAPPGRRRGRAGRRRDRRRPRQPPAHRVLNWKALRQADRRRSPTSRASPSTTYRSPASGGHEVRWLGRPVTQRHAGVDRGAGHGRHPARGVVGAGDQARGDRAAAASRHRVRDDRRAAHA